MELLAALLFLAAPGVGLTIAAFMQLRARPRIDWAVAALASVGVAAWLVTVATVDHEPRDHADDGTGWQVFLCTLLVAAAVAGWRRWSPPLVVGWALTIPVTALAPLTAPRGDGDGLWGLVFPGLPLVGFLLALVAVIAGVARHAGDHRRSP